MRPAVLPSVVQRELEQIREPDPGLFAALLDGGEHCDQELVLALD
jgi:hypothetical protein